MEVTGIGASKKEIRFYFSRNNSEWQHCCIMEAYDSNHLIAALKEEAWIAEIPARVAGVTGVRTLENLTSGMDACWNNWPRVIWLWTDNHSAAIYNHTNEEVRSSGEQSGSRTSERRTHHEASRERLLWGERGEKRTGSHDDAWESNKKPE